MTIYNNNRFTPGRKANLRGFMNRALIKQNYGAFINRYYSEFITAQNFETINIANDLTSDELCGCIQEKANQIKQGWNTPLQTQNTRISQILTGTLGGKTTFGNYNKPVTVNYLGGWEGQPGGLPRPLRNKF
jgi:hypothetical protein